MTDHWVQAHLFDGSGPERARHGAEQVLEPEDDWTIATLRRALPYLEQHAEVSADDFWRHDLWAWQPHHDNAIGAFFRSLRSRGYIGRPLRWEPSKRTQRNSGVNAVYPSLIWRGRK